MINKYAIGFVFVAGATLAGVDYLDQSKKAGLDLGRMPLAAYAHTIPSRFYDAKAETAAAVAEKERLAAWRRGGAEYLPEAPEGWTRRALLEGDDSAIMPPPEKSAKDGAGMTLLQQMEGRKKAQEAKERATRSFVYERGSETVFVEIDLKERPEGNSLIGLVSDVLKGADFGTFRDRLGFDTISGVGFVERLTPDGARKYHYRILEGRIGFGDEVIVRAHANASSAATTEILNRIDYDGLNKLLPVPMDRVGSEAVLPEGLDGAGLALVLDKLHTEFLSLRAKEAQFRIENIDTRALILNTYAQQLAGAGDALDLTGGKEMNFGTLIDMAYRIAVSSVRAGKSPDEVRADVTRMVETVMVLADAEAAAMAGLDEDAPPPAMSPELAAELGLQSAAQDAGASAPLAGLMAGKIAEAPIQASHLGQALMELDPAASEAAGGRAVSRIVDPDRYEAFMKARGLSESEMQLGLMVVARAFEDRHALPVDSCDFVARMYRLECKDAAQSRGGAMAGMIGKLTDKVTQQPARLTTGEKPTRLQLSNGGQTAGQRCVGSFCN